MSVEPSTPEVTPEVTPVVKARRGRPPKALIESKKPRHRGKVGRPVGDAGRINEFKARLLSTTGNSVIDKIVQVAMNDEHPGQMAALKMCIDRMLPLSLFEKDAKSKGSAVTINIVNASAPESVEIVDQAVDVEYTEVAPDE